MVRKSSFYQERQQTSMAATNKLQLPTVLGYMVRNQDR
jgi:hypothetical protein